ncbi:hypothetical protein [Micromonospora sp. SL4-19]|uniref:hypothetical protein n=1 Tax=Micromonospora sp. SL4-19 TaxID=3399129 RepID=UPI003A4DE63A
MTKNMRGLVAILLVVLSAATIIGRTTGASPFESHFAAGWPKLGAVPDPDLTNSDAPTAAAAELYKGTATLAQPTSSPFPDTIARHAESTSIIWNGQYLMYYRTFISPTGANCSIPQGVAMATSSDSGATWTPVDGGRPLSALQTVQDGQSCSFDDSVNSTWVYAPDVIADGDRLVMVFEQRDHDPNYGGPGQGRSLHSIRYVTSTDGRNWSNSTLLLRPGAVGAWDDEIGTPDIEKDGSGYILTFHGHDATGRMNQTRAVVRFDKLAGEYTGARRKIKLSPTPDWANFGVGKADMTRAPDGYWYIIFEAFSGASGECGRTDTRTVVGIARSADAVRWSVAPAPLIQGRDGLSCGYDMPSWQLLGDVRGIVTPNDPPESGTLVRWDIVAKEALSQP